MSQALHQERLMTVIRGPHLSEKAHFAAEKNQVVLKVRTDASKKEIAQAVTLLFEVEVESVTTVNVKGKNKRFQQTKGNGVIRYPQANGLFLRMHEPARHFPGRRQ